MCVGDMRNLRVPAALGYGAKGREAEAHASGGVPPNAVLYYQVTLRKLWPTSKKGYDVKGKQDACKEGTSWEWMHGCSNCTAGKHQPFSGQKGCYLCTKGKYQPQGGQRTCTACPQGSLAWATGTKGATDCTGLPTQAPTAAPTTEQKVWETAGVVWDDDMPDQTLAPTPDFRKHAPPAPVPSAAATAASLLLPLHLSLPEGGGAGPTPQAPTPAPPPPPPPMRCLGFRSTDCRGPRGGLFPMWDMTCDDVITCTGPETGPRPGDAPDTCPSGFCECRQPEPAGSSRASFVVWKGPAPDFFGCQIGSRGNMTCNEVCASRDQTKVVSMSPPGTRAPTPGVAPTEGLPAGVDDDSGSVLDLDLSQVLDGADPERENH
jgi:hypothetical protein